MSTAAEWLASPSLSRMHAGATLTRDAADTMRADIQSDVARSLQNDDPPLQSDLLAKTLTELANAATNGSAWAASLLESLWHRSRSGVPYGEPQEPSWSLDPESHHRPDERPEDDPWIPTCDGRNCGGRPHE